jgi:rubrerythrin
MTTLDDIIGLLVRSPDLRREIEGAHVHYECRACGTTLSASDIACTVCGADEIAGIVLQ